MTYDNVKAMITVIATEWRKSRNVPERIGACLSAMLDFLTVSSAVITDVGYLGAIAYNASAPTPERDGYYEFTNGDGSTTICTWINYDSDGNDVTGTGIAVSAGDRVSLNYDIQTTTYKYTLSKTSINLVQDLSGNSTSKGTSEYAVKSELVSEKYKKTGSGVTKYLSRDSLNTIIYPDSEGYGWSMTFTPSSNSTINGVILKPTKALDSVILSILQLPDDISGPSGTITILNEYDITSKWNSNIGVETEFYFDNISLTASKNYGIGYRDGNLQTHVGYYSSSFITGMSQVIERITSQSQPPANWVWSGNNTVVPFVIPCYFTSLEKYRTAKNKLGAIEGSEIEDEGVYGDKIRDLSITESKISDDSISTVKLQESSVTPEKTNFMELGNNLFNPSDTDVLFGYYIPYSTGIPYQVAGCNSTGYIYVEGLSTITVSNKHQLAFFINKSTSGYLSGDGTIVNNGYGSYTVTVPPLAKYLRATVVSTLWDTFMVNDGDIALPFESYGYKLNEKYANIHVPSIALPSNIYMLKGTELSIYKKAILEFLTDNYKLDFYGTNWDISDRYFRVSKTNTTAGDLTLSLKNSKSMQSFISITRNVIVSDPSTGTGVTKICQFIGDSFAYDGMTYLYINELLPDLSWVGIRKSTNNIDGTYIHGEGRGGWHLRDYVTDRYYGDLDSFSPFMHPVGNYKYYGSVNFWKKVKENSSEYYFDNFQEICVALGFETTGYKSNPVSGETVMHNGTNYVIYNGSSWETITGLTFEFNYPKYLELYDIDCPDFVLIALGCNDFRITPQNDSTFGVWKDNMDIVLDSIKAAATINSKIINVAICIPTTQTVTELCTSADPKEEPEIQRQNMWNARNRIINAFDNSTYNADNVFVVDMGSSFDGEYGFNMLDIKPFDTYDGLLTEQKAINCPHPSDAGYKQIATQIAGFIQSKR